MVYLTPHAIYFKIQRVLMQLGKDNLTYALCLLVRHNGQLDREGTFVEMPENIADEVKHMMFLAELNMSLGLNNAAIEWLTKTKQVIKNYTLERRMWQNRLTRNKMLGDLNILPKDVLVTIAGLI